MKSGLIQTALLTEKRSGARRIIGRLYNKADGPATSVDPLSPQHTLPLNF